MDIVINSLIPIIIEVDPKDGTINTLVDLKTSASYLCNVNDNFDFIREYWNLFIK